MAKMIIKTPTKSYTLKKGEKLNKNDDYFEAIKMRASNVALDNLSKITRVAVDRQISIMATFFQRVVARTPIDEKYAVTHTRKDGTTRTTYHKIDTIVCQDDWYITDGQTKLTAKQMKAIDKDLFWNVNEKYSVDKVKKILKETFNPTPDTNFEIGNDNPHFELLENGNSRWFNDGLTAGKSRGKTKAESVRREHGVKNMHSIQAPVGMWRITMAELETIKQSTVKSPLTSRYRSQFGRIQHGVPNRKKLMEFARFLESKKNIKYKDIVRYLEVY